MILQKNTASPVQRNSPSSSTSRQLRRESLIETPGPDEEWYDDSPPTSSPKKRQSVPRRRINSSPVVDEDDSRQELQAKWRSAARSTGAATISIVNDVNAETLPSLPPDFRYCEHHYVR